MIEFSKDSNKIKVKYVIRQGFRFNVKKLKYNGVVVKKQSWYLYIYQN